MAAHVGVALAGGLRQLAQADLNRLDLSLLQQSLGRLGLDVDVAERLAQAVV